MNLSNLAPAWQQYKSVNSLTDIPEAEILSAIEPKKVGAAKFLLKRLAQNAVAYSLLIFALHGCAV